MFEFELNDLPRFENPLRDDDQHFPFDRHVTRGVLLRQRYPSQLRKVTSLAKSGCTGHIKVIEEVRSADAQYALLTHYYRVLGVIEGSKRRPPMTLEEEITAYNMLQGGASIPEVASKLNKNPVTIWRLAPGEPIRKYHHLHRFQEDEIDRLHSLKTPYKAIAKELGLPPRTVRYYLYERKSKEGGE